MASSSLKYELKKLHNDLAKVEDKILASSGDVDAWRQHELQAQIFLDLFKKTKDPDVKFAFMLASAQCYSEDVRLFMYCAHEFKLLAEHIGSVFYCKHSLKKAREYLAFDKAVPDSQKDLKKKEKRHVLLNNMINVARSLIAASKTYSVEDAQSKVATSETSSMEDAQSKIDASETSSVKLGEPPNRGTDETKGLRSYWVGLDVNIKREFLKVSIAELKSFAQQRGLNKQFLFLGKEGPDTFEQVISSAKEDRKWKFWMCRTLCSKKFSNADEFKSHLEQEHGADFKPSLEKDKVKRIGRDWSRKISVGEWEPVDAEAAVGMIKNQLADVKAFDYKHGWSKEWPLAADEERSKLLKEIKSLLVSFFGLKILPSSIRDWLMRFSAKHLRELQVSEQSLLDSGLMETPQSICFLERRELIQIQDFLKHIRCKRKDGTHVVCRAVNSYLGNMQAKEKIDFDKELSYLLLDKRLLKSNNAPFNDEGTINFIDDPNDHYAKAHAQGDGIISWLADYCSVDKVLPRTIREHNLDIWVAVMKAVKFTCRNMTTKYSKKMLYLGYEKALTDIEILCMTEPEGRRNLEGDQWNRYASLLCDRCEDIVKENSLSTNLFLCAVRDVLEGASKPRLEVSKDYLNRMRRRVHKRQIVLNHLLEYINLLKSVVNNKVMRIDSAILLIDNSRLRLLNELARLSVFDNRLYMLRLVKPFLLNKIERMKSEATEAELLCEEEKEMTSKALKKNSKKNKKSSARMSGPLVEGEPSANLVPEGTSPSLKMVDSEDTLASELSQLEISSKTDNQEEATEVVHDLQNMPREVSLSEQLELAPGGTADIYGSALDMTLKALLNIKLLEEYLKHNEQPSDDHREEQVTCALQKVVTAFKSGMLEGVYGVLLSDLLASLKDVISVSGGAAEVLVTILQFWPCWKDPEPESLVNRFFMLEENERMRCIKCRWEPNYSDQRSYGIVMAADSIRDLKSAFGNIKFVDILKMIRMENKMLCDTRHGGCGERNFVRHFICRNPPIFTIVLTWEKRDTEQEISETTKALEWEIDLSRIYEDLEPNTNYRLVSMVGCGEEDEHICLAYGNNRWVNVMRDSLTKEDVGNWEDAIKFCEDRKVRPEILFYEGVWASSVRF